MTLPTRARVVIIGGGVGGTSIAYHLVQRGWRDVALRGCDSVTSLPEYPYRDDGMPIAFALRRWVDGYLGVWYADDAALARDTELAAWHRALGATDGAGLADVPPLASVGDLVDLVTTILYRVTAAHAVVKIHGVDEHSDIFGTGFFVDPTGTLYTAYAVGGEAENFSVEFNGKKYPAKQVVADIRSGIAMLKIDTVTPALPIGKSHLIRCQVQKQAMP